MGRAKGIDIRASSIRITFTWQGKQQRQTILVGGKPLAPTASNIRYAERLAAEVREKIRLGSFVWEEYFATGTDTATALTVDAQVMTWVESRRITASTRAAYDSAARFWSAALPGATLKTLKPSQIMRAIAARPELSGKTLSNYLSVLRESCTLAVRDGILPSSPVDGIEGPSWQKEPPDPFDPQEREAIIALAHQRYPGHVHNMIEFWFWTGLRTGELLGLHWENVDLTSKTILIREALVRGERKASTKTSTARTVILNSRALAALQRQRALTQIQGGAVFRHPATGEQWVREQQFRQSFWRHILKALSMRHRRAYNCRHTYATAMLMSGMTPAFCARQLGHSVEVFLRTYSRWIDGQRDDIEMQRLESSIGDKPGINYGNTGESRGMAIAG